jgi:hypothetical protein
VVTEFPLPTASSFPFGIAAGPDSNLWFTEYRGNSIGRVEVGSSPTTTSTTSTTIPPTTTQPPAYKCGTYHFFGLRGSDGPGNHATDGHGMGNEIDTTRLNLQKYFPALEYEAVPYYAIEVNFTSPNYWNSDYHDSEYTGIVQLQKQLRTFFAQCKTTYAVIAGYSQGADVVGDVYGEVFSTLTNNERKQIGAVIMLGDPRFVYNKKLAKMDYGDFDPNHAGVFALGAPNPHGINYKLLDNVFDICAKGDIVCNFSEASLASCATPLTGCAHTEYILRGWTDYAATLAASHLKKLPKLKP